MVNIKLNGALWFITDEKGNLIDDIDTDMIYHNAHLAVTEISEMGQYTFGNLQGWLDFANDVENGDIVICGKNFGSGSSRQHAVDCFKALGVSAIIAESYGAIYKRNAINAGFPILICPNLSAQLDLKEISKQYGTLNLDTGELTDPETNEVLLKAEPFNTVQMDIYRAGNLFEFGRKIA